MNISNSSQNANESAKIIMHIGLTAERVLELRP
jgi:hypothetical protein